MIGSTIRLRWARCSDFEHRVAELCSGLPEAEQHRAGRFRVEAARNRFIVARAILRHELGTMLGVPASQLELALSERGKPRLAGPSSGRRPRFNLSHSGELVVLAVSDDPVGVDVEAIRQVANADRLARRFFSPAERQAVAACCGERRDRAFLTIWTRKEAYLKATGLGVGMPLSGVETEPDPDAAARLVAVAGDRAEAARWQLREIEIPNAVCTLAFPVSAPIIDVRRVAAAEI